MYTLPVLADFVRERRIEAGLKQRELAVAIPVTPGYIAKIEQGAAGVVGESTLIGIAEALKLNSHETDHLLMLAGHRPTRQVEPDVRSLLSKLEPHPAAQLRHWRATETNEAFRALFPGLADSVTVTDWMFGDPVARLVHRRWHREAEILVGGMRGYAAVAGRHDVIDPILKRLWDTPDFARLWSSGVVYSHRPDPMMLAWDPATERVVRMRIELLTITSASSTLFVGTVEAADKQA